MGKDHAARKFHVTPNLIEKEFIKGAFFQFFKEENVFSIQILLGSFIEKEIEYSESSAFNDI